MSGKEGIVIAFDLYGTLLSTSSIAWELEKHFGEDQGKSIAARWRALQLEYTFRLNSMGQYTPFDNITKSSLYHALSEHSLSLEPDDSTSLLECYNSLSTFPDVSPLLEDLTALQTSSVGEKITPVIFSNGTTSMLETTLRNSPSLSPYSKLFRQIVSVDPVRCYKPSPTVYHHLARQTSKDPTEGDDMAQIWLVSGNPFDVVGARAAGMNAVWVDREGRGWVDRLVENDDAKPTVVVAGLGEVVGKIKRHSESKQTI